MDSFFDNIHQGGAVGEMLHVSRPAIYNALKRARLQEFTPCEALTISSRRCNTVSSAWLRLAQQSIGLYTLDLVGDLCLNLIPAISPHRPFQRRAQYTANSFLIARSIVKEKLNEAVRVKPELTLIYRRILNDIPQMDSLEMLRLAEGRAAQLYWNQWNFELAHYKDLPDHWRQYSNRTSPLTGSGRKAVRPVNAMLNYGLGASNVH